MIRAIAIDDERNALGVIREYAKKIPDFTLTETFTDPLKTLPYLYQHPEINLIFIDIQMSKLNGLELVEQLKNGRASIVLTTAYPDYALQSYQLDVIDYLLKPFSFDRFLHAVIKARQLMKVDDQAELNNQTSLNSPNSQHFIFVKSDYKVIKIAVPEILFIEGTGNYVTIQTTFGKFLSLQNMKNFEDELKPLGFFRIHKSYIISIRHIESITKKSVIVDNKELPIGDTFRDPFNDYMKLNFKQF